MNVFYLLQGTSPLRPCNAVAALLTLDDGRYVMQLRDDNPDIFYPGHWGCFGGAIDSGETPYEALRRELKEELELEIESALEFVTFEFDFSTLGAGRVFRQYFEVRVPDITLGRLVLHEGAAVSAIPGADLMGSRKVAPYDAFAVWIHQSRHRLASAKSMR